MTDAAAGNSAAFDAVGRVENPFESWARSLCEFVVRATILPVTLFFTKPSDMLRAIREGEYRPLPAPFLLTLITALAVAGPFAVSVSRQSAPVEGQDSSMWFFSAEFFESLIGFYSGLSGVNLIFNALPYIFILWFAAGVNSLVMLRGIRTAETLATALTFFWSALVQLSIFIAAIGYLAIDGDGVMVGLSLSLVLLSLVYAGKIVRLLLLIRKERRSSLIGAVFGAIVAAILVVFVGVFGWGLSFGVYQNREYIQEETRNRAMQDGQRALGEGRFQDAVAHYTTAIEASNLYFDSPESARRRENDDVFTYASLYNDRCWARVLGVRNAAQEQVPLFLARADCDRALELLPGDPNILDSRGLVQLRQGEFEGAYNDYNEAVSAVPEFAHGLYGRGLAQIRLGRVEQGQADLVAAVAIDKDVDDRYLEYGVVVSDQPQGAVQRSEPQLTPQRMTNPVTGRP